jgi:predicted nucleic acid-binding protein
MLSRACELRRKYGLMVNDSLIAVAAIDSGVDAIATADRDFDRVEELEVCVPGDVEKTGAESA